MVGHPDFRSGRSSDGPILGRAVDEEYGGGCGTTESDHSAVYVPPTPRSDELHTTRHNTGNVQYLIKCTTLGELYNIRYDQLPNRVLLVGLGFTTRKD